MVVNCGRVSIVRNAVKEDVTPVGRWFVMDGYSPVAMQESLRAGGLRTEDQWSSRSIPPRLLCGSLLGGHLRSAG